MEKLSYNKLYDSFLSTYVMKYFNKYNLKEPDIENVVYKYNELDNAYTLTHMHGDITTMHTKSLYVDPLVTNTGLFPIQSLYEVKHRVYRKECALYFTQYNHLIFDKNSIRIVWNGMFKLIKDVIIDMYKNLACYFLKDIFKLNKRKYSIKLYKVIDDYDNFITSKDKLQYFYQPFILYSALELNLIDREHERFLYRFVLFPLHKEIYYDYATECDTCSLDNKDSINKFQEFLFTNHCPTRFMIGNCFNKLLIVAYNKETNQIVDTYHFDSRGNGNDNVYIIWNRRNSNNIKGPFTFDIRNRYLDDLKNNLPLEWKYYTDFNTDIKELNYLGKE